MSIEWAQMITAEDKATTGRRAEWDGLVCSRLQGRLVLGAEVCARLDAMALDPETPWAMREAITNAGQWRCNSQTMDELAYLLGYTDDQRLDLFRQARGVLV